MKLSTLLLIEQASSDWGIFYLDRYNLIAIKSSFIQTITSTTSFKKTVNMLVSFKDIISLMREDNISTIKIVVNKNYISLEIIQDNKKAELRSKRNDFRPEILIPYKFKLSKEEICNFFELLFNKCQTINI